MSLASEIAKLLDELDDERAEHGESERFIQLLDRLDGYVKQHPELAKVVRHSGYGPLDR